MRSRCARNPILAALAAALLFATPAHGSSNRGPADGASKPSKPLCGRLSEHGGLPVLELWGNPEQAGYAHGFLLAEQIVQLFDGYVLDKTILPNPQVYEAMLAPGVRRQFLWRPEYERELTALARGMRDRLGTDRLRSEVLDRELTLEDLMAANALADWFGMLCTSFSAWGPLTVDGDTLTARNLDFPSTSVMERAQVVMIRRGDEGSRAWIGVGWPGLIGIYTAMNEAGVTMLMHDAPGGQPSGAMGFTPRALILREALQSAGATDFIGDVQRVLQRRRVLVGNNIHVSAALLDGRPPAVIFEYDADPRGGGVTVRTAQANGTAVTSAIWCTNHMRMRSGPQPCGRYERLDEQLTRMTESGGRLDPASALELIRSVKQAMTLHSVCFVPRERTMFVLIPAISGRTVEFRLDEWLKQPVGWDHRRQQAHPEGGLP